MNRETALFVAMPGGLSVVTMLAEQYKVEANRVVLCHTARLVILLVSAPIAIQWLSGIDLADANRSTFHSPEALDPVKHGLLAIVAVASWFASSRMRFPSAMLLLPLLSSALLHATGLVTVHVPPALSVLAQIVIGSGVGARFASYTLRQIARDGWLAALVGVVLAAGSLAGASLVAPLTGGEVAPLFLAYLPGGRRQVDHRHLTVPQPASEPSIMVVAQAASDLSPTASAPRVLGRVDTDQRLGSSLVTGSRTGLYVARVLRRRHEQAHAAAVRPVQEHV